jgi:hypothetical protein
MKNRIEENLRILNEKLKKHGDNLINKHNLFNQRVTRTEYSTGGNNSDFGYYSFDPYNSLVMASYRRGKLYHHVIDYFNYRYSFEEDQLIMIERFDEGKMNAIFFVHHEKQEKVIISYFFINYYRNDNTPGAITMCHYDEEKRTISFLEGSPSGGKVIRFEERIYDYTPSEVIIKSFLYHQGFEIPPSSDQVFPLSALDQKSKSQTTSKVTDQMIKDILKQQWISVMSSWNIKDGYAISVILPDQLTIEIDYAEEEPTNQNPYTSQRWDYTYWNHQSQSLLKSEKEVGIFEKWLDQYEKNHPSNHSLIENKKFIQILNRVIKELREESIIKNCFKKEVPVILTNFDLYEKVLEVNKKLNTPKLIKDYVKWFDEGFRDDETQRNYHWI